MLNAVRRGRTPARLRLESLENRRTPVINVAVVGSAGATDDSGFVATVAQLNDSTAFSFQASLVTSADVDTAGELSAFDAVVIGASGQVGGDPFDNATFTAAL